MHGTEKGYKADGSARPWQPVPFGLPPEALEHLSNPAVPEAPSEFETEEFMLEMSALGMLAEQSDPLHPTAPVSPLPQLIAELQAAMQPTPTASEEGSEVSDPSSAYGSIIDADFMPIWQTPTCLCEELQPPGFSDMKQQLHSARDTTDWQFPPALFRSYDLRYGPFTRDACSDSDDSNALCPAWWSPEDSYTQYSWSGCKIWCHPPFNQVNEVLDKAIDGFKRDPGRTCTLLALPD
ncbi:hypothetical protein ABBQ38_007791 [Trebouxia sp. C0009 RCD-2024]